MSNKKTRHQGRLLLVFLRHFPAFIYRVFTAAPVRLHAQRATRTLAPGPFEDLKSKELRN